MKDFCLTSDELKKIDLELVSFTQFVNLNMSEQITGCSDCGGNCEGGCSDGCISSCDDSCGADCSGTDYYSPHGY